MTWFWPINKNAKYSPTWAVANYSALPPANASNWKVYIVLNSQGTQWLPWTIGWTFYAKWYYMSDGAIWNYLWDFPYQANQLQVDDWVVDNVFVSPLTLKNTPKIASWSETSW
jgi:hypothetical protein